MAQGRAALPGTQAVLGRCRPLPSAPARRAGRRLRVMPAGRRSSCSRAGGRTVALVRTAATAGTASWRCAPAWRTLRPRGASPAGRSAGPARPLAQLQCPEGIGWAFRAEARPHHGALHGARQVKVSSLMSGRVAPCSSCDSRLQASNLTGRFVIQQPFSKSRDSAHVANTLSTQITTKDQYETATAGPYRIVRR